MTALLEVRGVTQRFGGLVALDAVSTVVESGEIHGLIGPNGAGKSTLLNVLTGLYRPKRGEVLLAGQSLMRLRPDAIYRRGVARTFQNVRIWPEMTLLENVLVAAYAAAHVRPWDVLLRPMRIAALSRRMREDALATLELFGLAASAHALAGSLSYGQRRLLELARACAAGPSLVLLDEPVAGLNPVEVADLAQRIRGLRAQGMTVLLVEHNMPFVMDLCDRITVLDFGRLLAEGVPAEIQHDQKVIDAYLGTGRRRPRRGRMVADAD